MKIAILTAVPDNYSSSKLIEAIEKAGHECIVINPDKCYMMMRRDDFYLVQDEKDIATDIDICISRFSEENTDQKLALLDFIEDNGAFMMNSIKGVQLANSKIASHMFLHKHGFKTPNSVVVANEDHLDHAMRELGAQYPVIVKSFTGAAGIGVMKLDSWGSLKSVVQVLLDDGINFYIQEMIKNEGTQRILIIGGKYAASMFRPISDEKEFRTNSQDEKTAQEYQPSESEIAMAENISKLTGLNFCAIDYILVNGEPVILEFNSSPGFETIDHFAKSPVADQVIEFCVANAGKEPEHKDSEFDNVIDTDNATIELQPDGEIDVTLAVNTDGDHDADDTIEIEIKPDGEVEVEPGEVEKAEQEKEEPVAISYEEEIIIKRINNDNPIKAKIDTGAESCSLHGNDIELGETYVKFEYNEVIYKVPLFKTIGIVNANGKTNRPVVKFNVKFNGNSYDDVEFNITDRSNMEYDVIIGKKLLARAGVIVDLSNSEEE